MTLSICRADEAGGKRPEAITIQVDGDLPQPSQETFRADAVALATALRQTLPGGTLDRLLVELLSAHASALRVAFDTWQRI